jgi:hypothetical protein
LLGTKCSVDAGASGGHFGAMLHTNLGPKQQSDFDHAEDKQKKTGAVNANSSAVVPL